MKEFSGAVVATLGFMVAVLLIAIYYAFAVQLLWGWFVSPLGFKDVSLAHAYGLVLFVNLFKTPEAKKVELSALLLPAMCVLIGYIVKAWM